MATATGAVSAAELVGRDQELAEITAAVARPPSVTVVAGEAGIGKSRLVHELRARHNADRRPFLTGACRQVREPFPLYPVVEAVRQLRQAPLSVPLTSLTGALRPLLPELADLLPPAPEPTGDRRADQHRTFRALSELLQAAGSPVLVLEDLHWADPHTPDFLRYLLADPPAGLSLVLTYRDEEVSAAVRALPARLPAPVRRAQIRLAPLDTAGTAALAAAILSTDRVSDAFAGYLCQRASGLPFAIEELLALLRARGSMVYRHGSWARRALSRLDVPAGIRDQVLARVSGLAAETRTVLSAASVLQVPVPPAVLAATSDLPPPRVWQAVEDALAAGVLTEAEGRIGFRHVLAAEAIYESLPEIRRHRLHAAAADALRQLAPPPLAQIAHHLRHAGRTESWVAVAEAAAEQAIALGHDEQAAGLLEEVLRHAPLPDDRAGRIAVTLARARYEAGGDDTSTDLLRKVLDRDLPDPVRGELSLRTALVMDHNRSDVAGQRELCLAAVTHLEPHRHDLRARAMACLGIPIDRVEVPLAEHREWQRRALDELAHVSDPQTRIRMLGTLAMVQAFVGDPQWRELLDRLDRIMVGDGGTGAERRTAAWAYYSVGLEACYAGHHDRAAELLARASGYTVSWERPYRLAALRAAAALIDYCRGEWDGLAPRVDRLMDELVDFAPARAEAALVAGCLRLARGDLAGARDRLATLTTEAEQGIVSGGIHTTAALRLALASGDPADAAELARHQLAAVRRRGLWAPAGRMLPVLAEALVAAGDRAGADRMIRQATAQLRQLDVPLATAALHHARGIVAAADQRWQPATQALLAAGAGYDRLRCPYEAAQARERAADSQFHAGAAAAAGESLRAALDTYQRLGATADLDRAARRARRYGVAPPARHRRGRHGYGDQLSPRQRDVARLVADGRTNQEIAAELYLSVSTVEKHVAAVLRKLDAGTRRQVRQRLAGD